MTNQSSESMIAEVRHRRAYSVYGDGTAYLDIGRLLEALELVRAERDAALAAIERVRAVHVRDEYGLCVACSWEYPDASYDAISNDVAWPCPTVAALDGALEPEAVEWEERLAACDKHGTHCWSCTRITERRRSAGPWLPVEGEKP